MKNPNRIGNAAKELFREVAAFLNVETKDLFTLYQTLQSKMDPRRAFCWCCLELESNPSESQYTSDYLQQLAERSDEALNGLPNIRPRSYQYELLFDLTHAFIVNSPREFLVNPPTHPLDIPIAKLFALDEPGAPDPVQKAKEHQVSLVKEMEEKAIEEAFGSPSETKIIIPAARPSIKWNAQQDKAFKEIFTWLKSPRSKPVFRTFGYAGTGKTTMAKEVAWNVESGEQGIRRGEVVYAAYTGKAAARLISKGCAGAMTIHSLIYRPKIDALTGRVSGFTRNDESPLTTAALLILDEVSMVNEEMAHDILSFGVPVLCLGDPEQLPPIKGEGYFINARPDVMLTDIERTVADNPIIYLATRARQGKIIKPGAYGDSRVYAPGSGGPTDKRIRVADQILVGTNRTREAMNKRYRMLNGKYDLDTQFPVKGDRLMCLKNNKISGLLNGTIWQCTQPEIRPIVQLKDPKHPLRGGTPTNIDGLYFKVRSEDMVDAAGKPIILSTVCSTHHFDKNLPEPPWREIAGTDEFTFGYAATAHKAQGSEWDRIVLIDESQLFRDMQSKHLYTSITRAAESIYIYQTDY